MTNDVGSDPAERVPDETARQLDVEAAGTTLVSMLDRAADGEPARPALVDATGADETVVTWHEYREQVHHLAAALIDSGVAPGSVVALMGRNRIEHVVADLAVVHAGAIPVSLYNTLARDQIAFVVEHARPSAIIVDLGVPAAQRFIEVAAEADPAVPRIVFGGDDGQQNVGIDAESWADARLRGAGARLRRPSIVTERAGDVSPETPACLIYTSGTTGLPKAVTMTHHMIAWSLRSFQRVSPTAADDRFVSYLPLAHAAERYNSHWRQLECAGTTYLVPDAAELVPVMRRARPTQFIAVPRVWEKLEAAMRSAGSAGGPELVGLDACGFSMSGAAPIRPELLIALESLGVPLVEVWGMTELTSPAAINPLGAARPGTVGLPLPGFEIRLADDGEVLVRAGCTTPGYYRQPGQDAALYDAEGYLRTGDLGSFDADGYLTIVGRKKDLLITAGGKNIAPGPIENALAAHPLISYACVVGEARPYLTALLALDHEVLAARALDPEALPAEVTEEIAEHVRRVNEGLARVEQIKRYRLLSRPWTPDGGLLTPTLKMRRTAIFTTFARLIEELYAEGDRQ